MSKACAQNHQAFYSRKSQRSHRDHMPDFQKGYYFVIIPQFLIEARRKRDVSQAQFDLITTIMSHAETFHVKRSYLDKIFSQTTLAKYLPKMEEDGWIRREKIPCRTGGYRVIYHTNSLTEWKINGEPVPIPANYPRDEEEDEQTSQTVDPPLGKASSEEGLNYINLNENKSLPSEEGGMRVSEENRPSAPEEEEVEKAGEGDSLECEDKEAKKAEDSLESEKTEDTSPEHIAAEEISTELFEKHGLKAKPLDVKKCLEFGCRLKDCKLEDILKQKSAAIEHVAAQKRTKGPVWHLRNWLQYKFQLPKTKLETNDAPKITPRQSVQPPPRYDLSSKYKVAEYVPAPRLSPEEEAAQLERARSMQKASKERYYLRKG